MPAPRPFSLREIVQRLGGEVVGEAALEVTGVAPLESAAPGQISFLANPRFRARLSATKASAVIVAPRDRDATTIARIVAENPYAYYARTVALFHPPPAAVAGIHATALIEAGASVASSAEVGPFAVIGRGARIGERCAIGAGCSVGAGCTVDEDTRLHANVTVYAGCRIGKRCIVHSGAVIGADGFGMAPEQGRWVKIPQVGAVRIGDDVEVGANTTIDRGALADTVIEEGVKLDNQIQVGHNCVIGAHTAIAGCVGIAGSVTIGRNCMIGGKAGITGHLSIADNVTVSAMTLITKSITKPGVYTSVPPFMPHADWLKHAARIRRGARGEEDREHDDH